MDIIRDKVAFEEGDVKDRGRIRKVRSFVSRSDNKVGEFLIESLEFTRVKVLIGAPYQVVPVAVQDRRIPWVKLVAIHHRGDDRNVVCNRVEDGSPNTPRGITTDHGVPQGVIDMVGSSSIGKVVQNTTRLVRAGSNTRSNGREKGRGDGGVKARVINRPDVRERGERMEDLSPMDVGVASNGAAVLERVALEMVDERAKETAPNHNCLYWGRLHNPGFSSSGFRRGAQLVLEERLVDVGATVPDGIDGFLKLRDRVAILVKQGPARPALCCPRIARRLGEVDGIHMVETTNGIFLRKGWEFIRELGEVPVSRLFHARPGRRDVALVVLGEGDGIQVGALGETRVLPRKGCWFLGDGESTEGGGGVEPTAAGDVRRRAHGWMEVED